MSVAAFPLHWPEGWPRTAAGRRGRAKFKVSADRVRLDLFAELRSLGAKGAVVSSNVPLRMDGTPLADVMRKAMTDPGVAVYFTYRDRPMVMARDAFSTPADNIRSLTWAIDAMRQLERHGGAFMMERAFSGFAALPSPQSCWDVLGLQPGASQTAIESQYRKLARDRHPDTGGSHTAMADLNAARDRALKGEAA